jgi:hypothetical protein
VPKAYQKGYGIPPLTPEDKRGIFGRNFAKLIGLDPAKVLEKIKNDAYSKKQSAKVRAFFKRALTAGRR